MLQKIEAALKGVLEPVFYGSADDVGNNALWNYIVFFRDRTSRTANNTSFTDYYTVAIINENYVPDDLISSVISVMESIPSIRLANSDIDFSYSRKPSTNAVIEIATLTFSRARR